MSQLLTLVFALLLSSCATMDGPQSFTLEENLTYFSDQENKDISLTGDYYKTNQNEAPLVILIHGGGWSSRKRQDMNGIAESLAKNGFDVFNISYLLAPEYKHPTQTQNLHAAVEFMKKTYQYKNSQIAAWGYSSGGHIASLYALQNPGALAAVVTGGAPYDLTWYTKSPYILKYLGSYRDEALKSYYEASPVSYVDQDMANLPAFFIYHGIKDRLVEHSQATSFEARLLRAGAVVERHDVSFWGHAMTFVFSSESVEKAIGFLKRQLSL